MFTVKFFVRSVIALIILAALVVASLLWGLNRYLGRPEAGEAIRAFVSNAAGMPVSFEKLDLDMVRGLTATGLRAGNPQALHQPVLLKSEQAQVAYNLWALLQRRFELTEILIDQPKFSLELDADNQVIWPQSETASAPPKTSEPSFAQTFDLEIRAFTIKDGTLLIQASDGAERLRLAGINNNAQIRKSRDNVNLSGQAKIGEVHFNQLLITDLASPYTQEKGLLRLSNITGSAYRGGLTGALDLTLNDAQLPFTFKLAATQCDLNEMLKQLAGQADFISGQFSANTSWRGSATNPRAISGKGNFEVMNGQLIKLAFLQQLAKLLQVNELAQPDFAKCRGDFTVENETISLASFLLNAVLFDFSGIGTVGFDGKLDLQCEMTFKPGLVSALPAIVADRLTPREDGTRLVAFHLSGTTDKPETDLWLKLALGNSNGVMDDVQKSVDTLKNIFH